MSPCDDNHTVEELITRLNADSANIPDGASDTLEDRRNASAQLYRWSTSPEALTPENLPSDSLLADLVANLDDPDARIRSHVTGTTLQIVALRVGTEGWIAKNQDLIAKLLDRMSDDDWRVRQSVLNPLFASGIAHSLLESSVDPAADLRQRFAKMVVNRLTDSVAAIRKRAGEVLVGGEDESYSPAELVLAHPDPEEAIPKLIDGLVDPVDEVATYRLVSDRSVRDTAGTALVAVAERNPALVMPHVDTLLELSTGRLNVMEVLVSLLDDTSDIAPAVFESCPRPAQVETGDEFRSVQRLLDIRPYIDGSDIEVGTKSINVEQKILEACFQVMRHGTVNRLKAADVVGELLLELNDSRQRWALHGLAQLGHHDPQIPSRIVADLVSLINGDSDDIVFELLELAAEKSPDSVENELQTQEKLQMLPPDIKHRFETEHSNSEWKKRGE